MSVDLPAPFSPIKAWISPARSSSEISSFASTPGNRFVTWSMTTRGGGFAPPASASSCIAGVNSSSSLGRRVRDHDLAGDDLSLERVELRDDVRRHLGRVRLRVVEAVLGEAEHH